jgi:hypothetical protein
MKLWKLFNGKSYTKRKNCSYCNEPFIENLWCKNCDPCRVIEGWTSENPYIDRLIKDTIYDARKEKYPVFLEWVSFNRFTNIKQIGKNEFSKTYSATWIDGKLNYEQQDDGSLKRSYPGPIKVALKRLNGSQNISYEYLNKVCLYYFYIILFT